MDEYVSKEEFRKISEKIHFELVLNKFDESKVANLNAMLKELKHRRAKSIILEINEANKEKGL